MTVHQSFSVLADDSNNNENNKVNHSLALVTPTTPTCRDPITLPPGKFFYSFFFLSFLLFEQWRVITRTRTKLEAETLCLVAVIL